MKKQVLLAGAIAITLGVTTPAHAGDCWPILEKHFTWAQSDIYGKNRHITFQLVTNQNDGLYASYTIGVMDVNPSGDLWLLTTNAGRTGNRDGTQYFSDRQYQECTTLGCYNVGPFNRNATDVLGVNMTWWGQVTLTLKSWGGGEVIVPGDCTNEMLISHVGNTAYVFSFKQTQSDIIY